VGVSQLVIGLTVVAYGTSTPELAVSLQAALAGNADIAVANVVGSNIFNVLFILGACAAMKPLLVHPAAGAPGSADHDRGFGLADGSFLGR